MNMQRLRALNQKPERIGGVVYWMSRDQRVQDNWALSFAADKAKEMSATLTVAFVLADNYPNANSRNLAFMLSGLKDVELELFRLNIRFVMLQGEPVFEILKFIESEQAGMIITDFDPLVKMQWKQRIGETLDIPFYEVDAHNIVPAFVVSEKQEYGAYTIRPKINKLLPEFLVNFPAIEYFPYNSDIKFQNQIEKHCEKLKLSPSFSPIDIISGSRAGKARLYDFIEKGLNNYGDKSNNPAENGQSGLSPYLHFGQISAQRIALEILALDEQNDSTTSFLEQLIIRCELSDNFCLYNKNYDNFDGFPDWAKKTLNEHRGDVREYLYSLNQFENAETHDEYWNAAQSELLRFGRIHGYMRMYWCKKILEWTADPETAMDYAIYLNDKYQLDGRDPNGYTGIAWAIGGVHDRAWSERAVFGKIRFMNDKGLTRKFDMRKYMQIVC